MNESPRMASQVLVRNIFYVEDFPRASSITTHWWLPDLPIQKTSLQERLLALMKSVQSCLYQVGTNVADFNSELIGWNLALSREREQKWKARKRTKS